MASRTYSFINAFGNKDNIKVEINFIDRIHIFNPNLVEVSHFGKHVIVNSPVVEELFGMKICALIDRSKPRDLYDVKMIMLNSANLDLNRLRKSALFYLSLDGIFALDKNTLNGIKAITQKDIKKELLPVLNKSERFDLEETKKDVIEWMNFLFFFTDDEKKYLEEFSKGNYNPRYLFDDSCSERVLNHPMARWRISCLKMKIG